MVSLNTPLCNFGWKAKSFNLLGVDDKSWTLDKAKGKNGLLIMFICNHCPYVKAILPRLVNDLLELNKYGINSIAISSNDVENYPEDSFEKMKKLSEKTVEFSPVQSVKNEELAEDYSQKKAKRLFKKLYPNPLQT